MYIFRFAIIIFGIKNENENWHRYHDRGCQIFQKKIENFAIIDDQKRMHSMPNLNCPRNRLFFSKPPSAELDKFECTKCKFIIVRNTGILKDLLSPSDKASYYISTNICYRMVHVCYLITRSVLNRVKNDL